jgi:hypothetical protein
MMGAEVLKVRCRTCNHEHKYRGNKGKKEMSKQEAFDKVLASVTGQLGGTAGPEKPKSKKKKT